MEKRQEIMNKETYIQAGGRNSCKTLASIGLYYINLEKELGCTFETIINATKYGIVDWEGKEHQVVFQEDSLFVEEYDKLQYSISLKNYRKSWWVKGEK